MTRRIASAALPDECAAVIVGSGFGASVVAARLAPHLPAGDTVVLERGVEWLPGDFPTSFADVRRATRSRRTPGGLFDLSMGSHVDSLVASGLGGGSLIYANVMLEPSPEVFDEWPAAITSSTLAPYFDRVRGILQPEVYIDRDDVAAGGPSIVPGSLRASDFDRELGPDSTRRDHRGRLAAEREPFAKAEGLWRLASAHGTRPVKVPVAIRMTRPDDSPPDRPLCTLCGNCTTGCNVGSKTTMRESYLPIAHSSGARLVTGVEVETVAVSERPGRRWRVAGTRWHQRGRRVVRHRFEVHCDIVALGAGALGTTAVLLRSSAAGLRLSDRVGHGFSGNGDSLAVAYASKRRTGVGSVDAHSPAFETGPTISAAVDLREGASGHLVQDGAIPAGVAEALRLVLGARFALQRDARVWCDLRGTRGCPAGCGAIEHSQLWLAMGSDGGGGSIRLDRSGRPRIEWPDAGRHDVFAAQSRDVALLAADAEAVHVANPRHALLGRGRASYTPITVHPLGGAVLADDVDGGVCDVDGRVFDPGADAGAPGDGVHDGLYVVDGSLCPTPIGANPSLTIAALAERISEALVRDVRRRTEAEMSR